MGKRIAIIICLVILICIVLSRLKINDSHSFIKGQETDYLNWCFENEQESAVKTSLAVFNYGNEELFFYLNSNNSFCYALINCENKLQWEEHGTIDFNKGMDSNEPIVIQSSLSTKSFKVFFYSVLDSIPDEAKYKKISFNLNDTECSFIVFVRFD